MTLKYHSQMESRMFLHLYHMSIIRINHGLYGKGKNREEMKRE